MDPNKAYLLLFYGMVCPSFRILLVYISSCDAFWSVHDFPFEQLQAILLFYTNVLNAVDQNHKNFPLMAYLFSSKIPTLTESRWLEFQNRSSDGVIQAAHTCVKVWESGIPCLRYIPLQNNLRSLNKDPLIGHIAYASPSFKEREINGLVSDSLSSLPLQIIKLTITTKMTYRTQPTQTKPKSSFDKQRTESQWIEDRIPPLISINPTRQKQTHDKVSLESLNQSQVRSIYTVDKEEIDRNTLDILNKSFKSQKVEKSHRQHVKTEYTTHEPKINQFETPLLKKDLDLSLKEEQKTPIGQLQEFNEFEYKNCAAVKLYNTLVRDRDINRNEDEFEFEWFKTKNPAELLANVLTNPSRLRLYIHYLLKQIHENQRARLVNLVHQEEIREYNPLLKEVYTNIIVLLSKITGNSSNSNDGSIGVSIFQNGIDIDIDPKASLQKRKNNEKIRDLRHSETQQQSHLQAVKKLYEQIIQNYAISIQNMNNNTQEPTVTHHPPLKESRVHVEVEEEEQEMIRKKNHTFGMKQVSARSSRQQ